MSLDKLLAPVAQAASTAADEPAEAPQYTNAYLCELDAALRLADAVGESQRAARALEHEIAAGPLSKRQTARKTLRADELRDFATAFERDGGALAAFLAGYYAKAEAGVNLVAVPRTRQRALIEAVENCAENISECAERVSRVRGADQITSKLTPDDNGALQVLQETREAIAQLVGESRKHAQ